MTVASLVKQLPLRVGGRIFRSGNGWLAAALGVCAFALAPILSVLATAVGGGESTIGASAFVRYVWETAILLAGVLTLSVLIAIPAAWLTTMCRFSGREILGWALLLPFAVPSYLAAYVYADLAESAGFNFRGFGGAILALSLANYPYIYIFARASFLQQACHIHTSARVLGCSPWATFWRVSLPIARPGLAVGIALAAMETLNDLAVAQHYGLNTLGAAIYDVWQNRGDWQGAARLSAGLMMAVFLIIHLENYGRARQKQHSAAERCYACDRCYFLGGIRAAAAVAICALPILAGFILPTITLSVLATRADEFAWTQAWSGWAINSVFLASLAAILTLALGAIVGYALRLHSRSGLMKAAAKAAQVGYAFPGTILALGFLAAAAALVNGLESQFNFSLRGFLHGGIWLLVAAFAARFLVIAVGAMDVGFQKISPTVAAAARGTARWRAFFTVYLPLLRPAFFAAALLLFVDAVKELPMTLILRPFNFETLSTVIYQYASDESLSSCAPAALMMIAACALPVAILHRVMTPPHRAAMN